MRRRRQRRYWIPVAVGKEETLVLRNQHIETQITLKCSIWEHNQPVYRCQTGER